MLQEDTYLGQINDPLSLNLYSYCKNNPLIYTDPTGHWEVGDEKLPAAAQAKIIAATDAYFKAQAAGNAQGKKDAQAAANAVRNDPANKSSTSNITTSGQAFTNAITSSSNKDSNGNNYITGSTWNAVSSGGSSNTPSNTTTNNKNTTTSSNPAVNQGAYVTTTALSTALALNKDYKDAWENKNMDLLLKGQGPTQRQYNDLALYYALKDISGGKLTDKIIDNNGGLYKLGKADQAALDFWYVDTSGKTLQDKGYSVNSSADDAIRITVSGNKITLDVQVAIYGTGATKSPSGVNMSYCELAIDAMKSDWGGKYWIDGIWAEVTVNVTDVPRSRTGISQGRSYIPIEIKNEFGTSNVDGITQAMPGDMWSTSNRGKTTLYIGETFNYSAALFRNATAHELGHNLGIGDAYESRDGTIKAALESDVNKYDRMRSIDIKPASKTSVFDVRKLITANQSNMYQDIR
jgi:hypothetical protein